MDQIQIQIGKSQIIQGFLKCCHCLFIAHLLDICLGGNEQFLSGKPAALDGTPHRFFILI